MIRRVCILGACLALLPTVSQAELLLLVNGVPGPSITTNYANWFNIESVAWGIDRSNAAAPHTITVSLELSANVSALAQASANGTAFRKVVIDKVSKLGVNAPLLLASRLTCDEALIREFSSSADPDDRAKVELDIRCGKLTWENFDFTPQGALARSAKGSWNFSTNTP